MTSFSLFGHCHGNCSACQIYFAPIHFLWVSMNTILRFLSSRLGQVLPAYGPLKSYTSDLHTHLHKDTHTHTTQCRGCYRDLIHMDTHRSFAVKGQGNKCSLLTYACACTSTLVSCLRRSWLQRQDKSIFYFSRLGFPTHSCYFIRFHRFHCVAPP